MSNSIYIWYYCGVCIGLKHAGAKVAAWKICLIGHRGMINTPGLPRFRMYGKEFFEEGGPWYDKYQTLSHEFLTSILTEKYKTFYKLDSSKKIQHHKLRKNNTRYFKGVSEIIPGYNGYSITQNTHSLRFLDTAKSSNNKDLRPTLTTETFRPLWPQSAMISYLEAIRKISRGDYYCIVRNIGTYHWEATDERIAYMIASSPVWQSKNPVLITFLANLLGCVIEKLRESVVVAL